MLDEKRIREIEDNGAAAAMAYREEIESTLKEKSESVLTAVSAYFADKSAREAKITDRVNELRAELDSLTEQVEASGPKLVQATISGDSAAFTAIQAELAALEDQRGVAAAQIELLESAHVSGDDELFRFADELADKFESERRTLLDDLRALGRFADQQVAQWRKVSDFSTTGTDAKPYSVISGQVAQMRRDFDGEDCCSER